jgi:DNA-binding response OmpR family regulator
LINSRPRLLIVEDDRATRSALARLFTLKGWEVATAGTVAGGMEALETRPDCVVLDLMLPDGLGTEALERIRATSSPTRVVICTGCVVEEILDKVRRLEPDALLTKPVAIEALIAACERVSIAPARAAC